MAVLLLMASSAFAAKAVVSEIGTPASGGLGAQFTTPRGVAINRSGEGGVPAGTFYVVDSEGQRIERFGPAGEFVSTWGWGVSDGSEEAQICKVASNCRSGLESTSAGAFAQPQGIAVDQASGTLYITDRFNRRIEVFSATGAFLGAFGWEVKIVGAAEELQICTAASGCAPGTPGGLGGQFGAQVGNLVVAPAGSPDEGDLYVANKSQRRIDVYRPTVSGGFLTGVEFVRAFGWDVEVGGVTEFEICTVAANCKQGAAGNGLGQFGLNSAADVAVDSEGNVFALDRVNKRVQEFSSTPAPIVANFGAAALEGAFGVEAELLNIAIDSSSEPNHVLVSGLRNTSTPAGRVAVAELDHAGENPVLHGEELTPTESTAGTGLAVAPGSLGGNIYLSTATEETLQGVYVLNEGPEIETPNPIGAHSATFHGKVVSNEAEVRYRFEYSSDGSNWTKVPTTEDASVAPAPGAVSVEAASEATLHGNTEYSLRLVATRPPGGFALSSAQTHFKTLASVPAVSGISASAITSSGARLEGQVNPENQATSYQFEYLSQAAYEANGNSFVGPNSAAKAPVSPAAIGSGIVDIPAAVQIVGLQPSIAYRYRLSATNATGTILGPDKSFATFPPSSTVEPCPNDLFRIGASANLPDCRAYEQATPVDKNGGSLQGNVPTLKASINGDAVTFESAAGVPGGEGAQEFPLYLASRGTSSWSSQGLLPPASAGSAANVLGWTPDFAEVFDSAGQFGVNKALLARSSSNGSLTTIVPYTSPSPGYSFAGASADAGTVLFGTTTALALPPGSPTAADARNLYAWNRDTGKLSLAGVLPDGSAPPEDSVAGESGNSGYTQDMRAVSTDGWVFFKTGEPAQIYLRENPTASETVQRDGEGNCVSDPAHACTLHVSASQKTNGPGPGGTDEGGPLPAAFQAATSDGSAAFFTSSEELTNDAHTIATEAISRANLDGSGREGVFVPTNAEDVAVDGAHIYWSEPSANAIGRADLDGNPASVEPSFISGASNPQGVTVDGSHLYWSNAAGGEDEEGTIGRANLNGTGVDQNFIAGASNPKGIAVDAAHIYWTNAGSSFRGIGRADLDGNVASVEQEFVADSAVLPQGVAVDGTHVYWTRGNNGSSIGRADLDGTSPEFGFLTGLSNPRGIAIDGSNLYWTDTGTGSIGRAKLNGGASATGVEGEFVTGIANAEGLATDASHLYWPNHPSGRGTDLYSYQASTQTLTDLTSDPTDPAGAEVEGVLGTSEDGSYIYFVANGILAPGASAGNCQGPLGGASGICNLYLLHGGTTSFIARLDAGGGSNGDVANWVPEPGVNGSFSVTFQKTSRVTPDGRTLLFRSRRQLGSYDNEGTPEFYRYRVGDSVPTCISCNPTGASPEAAATLGSIFPPVLGANGPTPVLARNLSADGQHVFFETKDALLAADTNGAAGCPPWGSAFQKFEIATCQDVYEWEAEGSGSCRSSTVNGGCLYLLSTGKGAEPAFFADASASGDDAFIFTASQLVNQDRDGLIDGYDVRVGGGLASQNEAEAQPCTGQACKGQSAPPPAAQLPGSAGFSGAPNQKPNRHHKKKHRKHHKNQHRKAKTTGRASR
ncbi:MAG TPA: hypothetical protein VGN84_02165 [Solirubrobacterales bacterium]|nr:hypothetical protein [Solirubrobacterales bacterium]